MGEVKRGPAEIQQEIERVRQALVRDVSALESVVRDRLDWRRPIREKPLAAVGGAFALGFIIGLL